jgi:hypothetical protein
LGLPQRNHEGEAAVEESGEARVPARAVQVHDLDGAAARREEELGHRGRAEAEREGEGEGAGIHPAPDGGQVKEERQGRWPQQRRVAERGEFFQHQAQVSAAVPGGRERICLEEFIAKLLRTLPRTHCAVVTPSARYGPLRFGEAGRGPVPLTPG